MFLQLCEQVRVRAEARVGDITRTLEAVLDRSDPNVPLVLAWRME